MFEFEKMSLDESLEKMMAVLVGARHVERGLFADGCAFNAQRNADLTVSVVL